ncbi:phospholipid scramblase 2-like [Ornithodoros turicata]|uniref:phospholipid scramblase 2-like n=1 Tax=Ornithodoros turicata TaxID=34597 RepID=UPI003139DCD0
MALSRAQSKTRVAGAGVRRQSTPMRLPGPPINTQPQARLAPMLVAPQPFVGPNLVTPGPERMGAAAPQAMPQFLGAPTAAWPQAGMTGASAAAQPVPGRILGAPVTTRGSKAWQEPFRVPAEAQVQGAPVIQQPQIVLAHRSGSVHEQPAKPRTRASIPGCTPGLEYLVGVSQIFIHPQPLLVEVLNRYNPEDRYVAKNNLNETLYNIGEVHTCPTRYWWKQSRSLEMHAFDVKGRVAMRFVRPYRWQSTYRGCFCCCLIQEIEVQAPPGRTVGFVYEECSLYKSSFSICDRKGIPTMRVIGPCFTQSWACCPDVKFQVYTLGNKRLGAITKQGAGAGQEKFVEAWGFSIAFPVELDVHAKTCLIACAMLIDYMFFEENELWTCFCPGTPRKKI